MRGKTQSQPVSAAGHRLDIATKIINMTNRWHERQKTIQVKVIRSAGRVGKRNRRPIGLDLRIQPWNVAGKPSGAGGVHRIGSRTIQWSYPGEVVLVNYIGDLRPHRKQRGAEESQGKDSRGFHRLCEVVGTEVGLRLIMG